MKLRGRKRLRAVARWFFLRQDARVSRWGELISGLAIVVGVAVVNSALERAGLYERLEWADLDRLQQTSPATDAGDMALVLIGDDEYADLFGATSPLDPETLTGVIADLCRMHPRLLAIDILTSDWPRDHFEQTAAAALGDCPVVWLRDHRVVENAMGGDGTARLEPLGVVGRTDPPPGVCSGLGAFQPDADGVIRRYNRSYPTAANPSAPTHATLVYALAARAAGQDCESMMAELVYQSPGPHRIRFTSQDSFPRLPLQHLLEAEADEDAGLRAVARDRILILGGAYRHARDMHRTPVGMVHGSELIAHAIYTETAAPIADVPWWQSLGIGLIVSSVLLIGLTWIGLRWPWAVLASLLLSALAALVISWLLHKYLGYFLGVLGGLLGVVLAEMAIGVWKPMADMWRGWLQEFPAEVGNVRHPPETQAAGVRTPASPQPPGETTSLQPITNGVRSDT